MCASKGIVTSCKTTCRKRIPLINKRCISSLNPRSDPLTNERLKNVHMIRSISHRRIPNSGMELASFMTDMDPSTTPKRLFHLFSKWTKVGHCQVTFRPPPQVVTHCEDLDFDKANEILFRLGIIYKQQGKYDESLACFDRILRNPPSPLAHADIWFQIGHVYEQQKDVRKYTHSTFLPDHAI